MAKVLLFFFMALQFTLSHAQTFSNLDFEYWQENKYPLLWQHPAMVVTSDSVTKLSGKYSLKAVRQQTDGEKDKSSYGLILQSVVSAFKSSDMVNKKIDVSVQIKNKSLDSTMHVAAFIQIIDKTNSKNNNISVGNYVVGSEWAKSSASIMMKDITPNSMIYMGAIIMGYGEIWLDDYQIKLNDEPSKEVSPRVTNLTGEEKQWLKANISPISDKWLTDKRQLGRKFTNPRMVGIGENVHGSSSLAKLKNKVSRTLIEDEGYTILAVEDSPGVGDFLNRYIQGLSDVATRRDMNVMYANKDFRDFMSWLREYNKSATKKVRVFGVDINARYEELIETVDTGTSNKYSVQLDSIHSIFKMQLAKWNARGYEKIPFSEDQKSYFRKNLELIKNDLKSLDIDKEQKMMLCYYVDNLLHYLSYSRVERERQMADNICWLHSRYSDEKIVYLAHNSHVGNNRLETKSAGAWLKERLQDKYYIMGACYYDGTDSYKRSATANNPTSINHSVKGSYEYLFNQIENNCFYLDFSRLNNAENTSNEWLTKPMLMRNYGVEPFNYYHEFSITDITHEYDGVLFIKRSVPL